MKWRQSATLLLVGLMYGVPGPSLYQPTSLFLTDTVEFTVAFADSDKPIDVAWETLHELDYKAGQLTPTLNRLDGALVRVPGFVIPLEDTDTTVSEFLLVPYFGACIHAPPPPPNLIVHVRMAKGKKIAFDFWRPLWVQGHLKIAKTTSPYGEASYQLTGLGTQHFQESDLDTLREQEKAQRP